MSLIYIDGFDHYASTNGVGNRIYERDTRWAVPTGTTANDHASFATMPGIGSLGLTVRMGDTVNPSGATAIVLPTGNIVSGQTLGVGFHFYMSVLPTSQRFGLFGFGSGVDIHNKVLGIDAAGKLLFKDNTGTTTVLANSGANVLAPATLYFIETKIFFHATTGTVEVRVNGVTYLNATGLNTMPTSTSNLFVIRPQANNGTPTNLWYYDNLFIWDGTGSINNNFLGEQVVYTLYPSADTGAAAWTKSTGSNGYDLINDVPAVDTRYVEGNTVGDISIFDLTDLPTTALTVAGVQTNVRAEKTDALGGTLDFGPKHSSSVSLKSSPQSNGTFAYFNKIDELCPSTSAAWTATQINATQIELSRTA